jgi:hypothetical protein
MKESISRREMLQRVLQTTAAGVLCSVIGPSLLSSCDKKSPTKKELATEGKEQEQLPDSCADQDKLTPQELAIRKNLKYVDQTPISTRTCSNCKLYTNPAPNNFCGGCKILPGPVHPKGYCNSWYARM